MGKVSQLPDFSFPSIFHFISLRSASSSLPIDRTDVSRASCHSGADGTDGIGFTLTFHCPEFNEALMLHLSPRGLLMQCRNKSNFCLHNFLVFTTLCLTTYYRQDVFCFRRRPISRTPELGHLSFQDYILFLYW